MNKIEQWVDLPGYVGIFKVSDKGRVRAYGRIAPQPATLMGEIWRDHPAHPGVYAVSSLGRVKSLQRTDGRGHHRVDMLMAQSLSGPEGKKYYAVSMFIGGIQRTKRVHLLVLETFIGPRPYKHEGCHSDGDKLNNRLDNLRWDTPGGNNRDKREHGTNHQVNKTHCPRGHEYTPDNAYDPTMTARRCKECARERARNQAAPKTPRTHCRKGHEMTPDNTVTEGTRRKCRACKNARQRERYHNS